EPLEVVMSLWPLFLQVSAATPPADPGSTPADATPSPTPDSSTTSDASRTDAGSAVDASTTPDASTPADTSTADASAPSDAASRDATSTDARHTGDASHSADAGLQVNLDTSFYVAAGACYSGRGFGNRTDDYHEGGCFQLTAGFPTARFG